MIEKTYLPKNAKSSIISYLSTHNAFEQAQARKRGITVSEYRRRDDIVRKLHLECAVKVGDTVFPEDKKDYEEYGPMIVTNIASSYRDMEDKWPVSNNPLIVVLRQLDKEKKVMFATINWFVKKNPHLCAC